MTRPRRWVLPVSAILAAIRKVKSEAKVSIKTPITVLHPRTCRHGRRRRDRGGIRRICAPTVSAAEQITWHAGGATLPGTRRS